MTKEEAIEKIGATNDKLREKSDDLRYQLAQLIAAMQNGETATAMLYAGRILRDADELDEIPAEMWEVVDMIDRS